MRITPFGLFVALIIVPFVILPILASVGAAFLMVASSSLEAAMVVFFLGLAGGAGIILGTLRWLNYRPVNPPDETPDATSASN